MSILTIESWPPINGVIKIHKGATFDPVMTWRDSSGPINWTGYTGSLVMQFSNNVSITLTTANGGMVMNALGEIRFLITDTNAVPIEIGYFSIAVIDPASKIRILSKGRVEVD